MLIFIDSFHLENKNIKKLPMTFYQCSGSQPLRQGPKELPEMSQSDPQKVAVLNILCKKIRFASKYEEVFNNFTVRCSATFKELGNTAPVCL